MPAFRKHTEANLVCHGAHSAPAGLVFSSPSPLCQWRLLFSFNAVHWLSLPYLVQQIHLAFPPQRSPFSTSCSMGVEAAGHCLRGVQYFPRSLSFSQEDSPNMSRWFALGVLPWHCWKLSFTLTSQLGQFRNSHRRECLSSPEKPNWEHCTCTRSRW